MAKLTENKLALKSSAAFNEKLWCSCLGTKYKTKEVSNINQPNILKMSGYFELSADKISPTAGIILVVISA